MSGPPAPVTGHRWHRRSSRRRRRCVAGDRPVHSSWQRGAFLLYSCLSDRALSAFTRPKLCRRGRAFFARPIPPCTRLVVVATRAAAVRLPAFPPWAYSYVKGSGRHCHSRRLRLLGRLRLATERPHRASPNIRCRCCACRCSFVRSRCSGFSRRNFVFVFLGASLKRPSAMRDLPACEQAWARVRDVACPPRRFVLSALRICRSF